jgi:hypothetical protein
MNGESGNGMRGVIFRCLFANRWLQAARPV